MDNFGPSNNAMGKLETNKQMGKLCVCVGRVNGEMGNLTLDGAMEHLGAFDNAMGKLETLAMAKFGP